MVKAAVEARMGGVAPLSQKAAANVSATPNPSTRPHTVINAT